MKLLFIGLGSIGQRHVRNLRQLYGDTIELLAYREIRRSPLISEYSGVNTEKSVESEYHITTFNNLDIALNHKPNAVFICNPTSKHISVAISAAQAGCHLFIEKPLSDSLVGVEELIRITQEKKLITHVAYHLRFHPALIHLKKLIDNKDLGNIHYVLSEFGYFLPLWHPYEDYRQSYAGRKDLGGGVVLTQIHNLDILGWLFGWPCQVASICSQCTDLDIDVEDTADIIYSLNLDNQIKHIYCHLDYYQNHPTRRMIIHSNTGTGTLDIENSFWKWVDNDNRHQKEINWNNINKNQIYIHELEYFINCIKTNQDSFINLIEGVKSLKIGLAAKKSSHNSQFEKIYL